MVLFSPQKKPKKQTPIMVSLESVDLNDDDTSPFYELAKERGISKRPPISGKPPLSSAKSTPRSGSICNKFPKEECNPPACEYVEGEKRHYCRMSRKYKKNARGNSTRRIKTPEATEKIKKFLKGNPRVIKAICGNSSQCISFGKMTTEITNLFKGFAGFEYAVGPIKSIGPLSNNGFVKQIEYLRNGYKAFAILKSSISPDSDNLIYEYLVGEKFINRYIKKFPCFVETYGRYFYKSNVEWTKMNSTYPIHISNLNGLELQKSVDFNRTCRESKLASILIQHISGAKSVADLTSSGTYDNFIKYNLLYVFFIIYQALASLSKIFTHYDLHDGNVLLYEPAPGKFIRYYYHLKRGEIIEFNCPFVPKIIDYGRSFFDNGNVSSKTIYDKLCKAANCVNCGKDVGFTWLAPITFLGISSQKKNESHDLRLVEEIRLRINAILHGQAKPTQNTYIVLDRFLNQIKYGRRISGNKRFGTKENLDAYVRGRRISNVTAAYDYLKEAIKTPDIIAENSSQYNNPADKIGDFHIYEDGRDMEYVPIYRL